MSVNAEILADSPVAYWPLNGSLNDQSGNGHLLVRTAGEFTWTYGMLWGGAFSTTASLGTGDWTIRATVNIGAYSYWGGWVIGDGDGGGGHSWPTGAGFAWVRGGMGGPWLALTTSAAEAKYVPDKGYSPIGNRLIEVTAVCAGGTVEMWVDGVLLGSGAGDSATGATLVLEQWDSGCARGQIAVFDYALSPWRVNVQTLGTPELGDTPQAVADAMEADGAVGVWTVPAGDGDELVDQTGTSGNGTAGGGGFTSPAQQTPAGFVVDGTTPTWNLPVALDAAAFTIEFLFYASAQDLVTDPFTVGDPGGDRISVGHYGSPDFEAHYDAVIGSDFVSWTGPTDPVIDGVLVPRVHHVAVTWWWDGTTGELTLVVDGVVRDQQPVTGAHSGLTSLDVAATYAGQGGGTIAVYDSVLTPAQLADRYLLLVPAMLPACVVDTFDRADGPLGNSSLQSKPWADIAGVSAITGNAATSSRVSYLADTHTGTGMLVRGAEATVTDGGVSGVANVGIVGVDLFVGARLDFALGQVSLVQSSGDGSWAEVNGSPVNAPVDVSSGSALLRFQIDDGPVETEFGTGWSLSAWVDGVPAVIARGVPISDDLSEPIVAFGTDGGTVEYLAALEPAGLGQDPQVDQAGGLEFRFDAFDGVLLGSSPQPPQTGGLLAPADPVLDPPIVYLGSSAQGPQVGGVRVVWTNGPPPPPPPPGEPVVWEGVGEPPADLQVAGYPKRTGVSCQPRMNGAGTGSFTCVPPGPALGTVISYVSGGGPVFTGYADQITTIKRDQAEEAGQLVTVTTPDMLSIDWSETVVWPDFGAFEPIRVGSPPQDDREFGWPMNGILTDEQEADLVPSVGNDPARYGTPREVLPIPDNFPDSTARWMWPTSPDNDSQPQGWCFFRVPFGSWPGKYACFLNAWDYAKMWIDGAPIGEVTTPGQTVRVDVQLDWDFHLLAIAAYNESGPAGVMASVMMISNGLNAPVMNSRGGWKALAYPEKTLRAPIGKVLRRLVAEASARGAPAGGWSCAFSDDADSRGRAWPGKDLIVQRTGQTYWDVLNQAAESHIDFHASPASKTLYAYVKDQGAGSVGQPWPEMVHAESLAFEVGGR